MQDKYTEPHWDTSALVIIDMQNGFVTPKVETEGTKAHAIISNIVFLLDAFRAKAKPIIHVVRSYLPDGSDADIYRRGIVERGEFIISPESDHAEIVAALMRPDAPSLDFDTLRKGRFQELGPDEWAMYKPRLGAFHKTPLEDFLRRKELDTLIFAGTFFPNCVRQSVYEANERDFRTVAVTDAIFGIHGKDEKELGAIGATCLAAVSVAEQG
jgi:nicotinamidase-related amidase